MREENPKTEEAQLIVKKHVLTAGAKHTMKNAVVHVPNAEVVADAKKNAVREFHVLVLVVVAEEIVVVAVELLVVVPIAVKAGVHFIVKNVFRVNVLNAVALEEAEAVVHLVAQAVEAEAVVALH